MGGADTQIPSTNNNVRVAPLWLLGGLLMQELIPEKKMIILSFAICYTCVALMIGRGKGEHA